MRPPHFCGGNMGTLQVTRDLYGASMRPPHFCGGNCKGRACLSAAAVASMRPPHFCGGNQAHGKARGAIEGGLQ